MVTAFVNLCCAYPCTGVTDSETQPDAGPTTKCVIKYLDPGLHAITATGFEKDGGAYMVRPQSVQHGCELFPLLLEPVLLKDKAPISEVADHIFDF